MTQQHASVPLIADLWYSRDPDEWRRAVERYWTLIQPRNIQLERAIEATAGRPTVSGSSPGLSISYGSST